MDTKKLDEAGPGVESHVDADEVGPSRRDILVHGSKVAAGIGVAA